MLLHLSDNKKLNAVGNWFLGISTLIALFVWIWAGGINADRAAQTVATEDAGAVVSVAITSASSGVMFAGVGAVTAEYITTVETTMGAFVLPGKLSFMKNTPLRIETQRDGYKRICSGESCYPVAI